MIRAIRATLLLFAAVALNAQEADIVYVEGYVDVKDTAGSRYEAEIGETLSTGDSVITGDDGRVEIERSNAAVINVAPRTVFTLMEIEEAGETRQVLSCALGSVKFKFNRLTGREPRIVGAGAVAGVRGTEFTVHVAEDGSTLFAVESGAVEVSAAGRSVALAPNQGVEVRPGEAPGEPFVVEHGKIDYADWNGRKLGDLAADPVGALEGVEKLLREYALQIDAHVHLAEENAALRVTRLEEMKKVKKEKGNDEAAAYFKERVQPLDIRAGGLQLTIRFYALSALSLRRHVLGRIYLRTRTAHIMDLDSDSYRRFDIVYHRILTSFEEQFVPHLVDADI